MSQSNNPGGAGGKRPGAGRRPKPLATKLEDGNPGHRPLKVLDLPEIIDLPAPEPHSFVDDDQRMGDPLQAREIFNEVYSWLRSVGCDRMVFSGLVERYAMSAARWIQLERLVSRHGLLSRHPSTKKECRSPLVSEAVTYQNQANRLWDEIFQIVQQNCSVAYTGRTPQDDTMDRLLRARGNQG
ncbi:MAG: P27 family phage terminase small subunit [Clostridiales bacterium]|nr:P27 family phage terminase small subunit [Clostridiales bacterium]